MIFFFISFETFLPTSILSDDQIAFNNTCQTSSTDEDVCGEAFCEKRPSENHEIVRDYKDDLKHSDDDVAPARQSVAGDKSEIEIESIDRHVPGGGKSEVCHRIREEKRRKNDQSL